MDKFDLTMLTLEQFAIGHSNGVVLRRDVVHQLVSFGEFLIAFWTTARPLELAAVELKLSWLEDVPHFRILVSGDTIQLGL